MSAGSTDSAPHGSELHRWVLAVGDALGVEPDALDIESLLDLAREVAHDVARPAVPLTTFLAGYAVARAGGDRAAFDRVIAQVGALAGQWPGEAGAGSAARAGDAGA